MTAAVLVVAGVLIGAAAGLAIRPSGRASAAPNGPIDHPDGAGDVLLRIEDQPADVSSVTPVPLFTLYGDGTVIADAGSPSGQSDPAQAPAIPALRQQRLSEAGIQAVLRRAAAAGLAGPSVTDPGPPPSGSPGMREVFTMSVTGMHRQRVFAGNVTEPPAAGEGDASNRARLAELQSRLADLASWLPPGAVAATATYSAPHLAVYVGPAQTNPPGASVVAAWPLDASPGARLATFGTASPVEGFRCGVLEGAAGGRVAAAAGVAIAGTLWRSGSKVYQVVFRPLLPDEAGC